MPNSIGSVAPNQRVALVTALKAMLPALQFNTVRNGAGSLCSAPCGTSRTPGRHQQAVHGQALGTAIAALTAQRDAPDSSPAERTALQQAVTRLTDSSQPPLGARVVNQLTVLGAVYAAGSQQLEAHPGNPFLADLKDDIANAIIDIGTAAARCGAVADGFYHGDGASKQLVAAINKAQDALASARDTLGDQVLFNAMAATVMSSAMMASLNERLPQIAARFGDAAEVADLMNVLQRQYAEETGNAVARQLTSGDPGDFVAAVFAFLKLPEYVVQACTDQPGTHSPPAPEDAPGLDIPSLLQDLQSLGQGGNQAVNVSPNVNVNDFSGLAGEMGASLKDVFNLGKDAGAEIGGLKARLEAAEKALQDRAATARPGGGSWARPGWSHYDGRSLDESLPDAGAGVQEEQGASEPGAGDDADSASTASHAASQNVPSYQEHFGPVPTYTRPANRQVQFDDDASVSSRSSGTDATSVQHRSFSWLPASGSTAEHAVPHAETRPSFAMSDIGSDASSSTGSGHTDPMPRERLPEESIHRAGPTAVHAGSPQRPVDSTLARYFVEVNQLNAPSGARWGTRWMAQEGTHAVDVQRPHPSGAADRVGNPLEQVLVSDLLRFQQQINEPLPDQGIITGEGARELPDSQPLDDEFVRFLAEKHAKEVETKGRDGTLTVDARQVRDFAAQYRDQMSSSIPATARPHYRAAALFQSSGRGVHASSSPSESAARHSRTGIEWIRNNMYATTSSSSSDASSRDQDHPSAQRESDDDHWQSNVWDGTFV